ncbi:MAG: hypothetical protein Q9167_008047, partial [Letrouitia subvulpina]
MPFTRTTRDGRGGLKATQVGDRRDGVELAADLEGLEQEEAANRVGRNEGLDQKSGPR